MTLIDNVRKKAHDSVRVKGEIATLQETIIAQLGVKPSIDPKEEPENPLIFLKAHAQTSIP